MKIKNFKIIPYEYIGELYFGETRTEIRKKYSEYEEFKKTPFSINTMDAYEDCHLGYNENDELEFVETFPGVNVSIFGNEISFKKKYFEVKKYLKELDENIQEDENGLTSYKYGVGITLENKSGLNMDIQSVFIFCKNYYEN